VVRKGAFKSARPPIPMLASHDQADVVGVWDALEEVAEGLKIKGRLLIKDVARAREVLALIKEGAMTGLSIGYVTRKSARTQGGRDLLDVELLEVSVVAVPMHPGARITAAKSQKGETMDPEEFEAKLKEIETKSQKSAADLIAAAVLAATKPLTDRLAAIEAKGNRWRGQGRADRRAQGVQGLSATRQPGRGSQGPNPVFRSFGRLPGPPGVQRGSASGHRGNFPDPFAGIGARHECALCDLSDPQADGQRDLG
jgi:HK97 family phage prohead protease